MQSPSRRRAKDRPIEIRSGNVAVTVYTVQNQVGDKVYPQYVLTYYQGTQRVRRKFSALDEAKREAEYAANRLAAGEAEILKLSGKDRACYVDALEVLRAIDSRLPLNVAIREYADARRTLPPNVSLRDAVTFYSANAGSIIRKRVGEVVEEFKATRGRKTKRGRPASEPYLHDLNIRLDRLAASFNCDLADISPDDLRGFLEGLNVSARSMFNYARVIRTFFNFAKTRRYYPKTIDPFEGIELGFDDDGEIEIFTPEEMVRLLNAARPEILPFLALGAFAGLRHAELKRLEWDDIWRIPGFIEIRAVKSKTRSRRLVPILPGLAEWLRPYRGRAGHVVPFERMSQQLKWLATATAEHGRAGVRWKHNGLRHSFISYRLSQTQNENQVAQEAGNSPAMVFKHYRQLVTPGQAKTWFAIVPPGSAASQGKVVAMEAAAS